MEANDSSSQVRCSTWYWCETGVHERPFLIDVIALAFEDWENIVYNHDFNAVRTLPFTTWMPTFVRLVWDSQRLTRTQPEIWYLGAVGRTNSSCNIVGHHASAFSTVHCRVKLTRTSNDAASLDSNGHFPVNNIIYLIIVIWCSYHIWSI